MFITGRPVQEKKFPPMLPSAKRNGKISIPRATHGDVALPRWPSSAVVLRLVSAGLWGFIGVTVQCGRVHRGGQQVVPTTHGQASLTCSLRPRPLLLRPAAYISGAIDVLVVSHLSWLSLWSKKNPSISPSSFPGPLRP